MKENYIWVNIFYIESIYWNLVNYSKLKINQKTANSFVSYNIVLVLLVHQLSLSSNQWWYFFFVIIIRFCRPPCLVMCMYYLFVLNWEILCPSFNYGYMRNKDSWFSLFNRKGLEASVRCIVCYLTTGPQNHFPSSFLHKYS
jgi:hypothetical protein